MKKKYESWSLKFLFLFLPQLESESELFPLHGWEVGYELTVFFRKEV